MSICVQSSVIAQCACHYSIFNFKYIHIYIKMLEWHMHRWPSPRTASEKQQIMKTLLTLRTFLEYDIMIPQYHYTSCFQVLKSEIINVCNTIHRCSMARMKCLSRTATIISNEWKKKRQKQRILKKQCWDLL